MPVDDLVQKGGVSYKQIIRALEQAGLPHTIVEEPAQRRGFYLDSRIELHHKSHLPTLLACVDGQPDLVQRNRFYFRAYYDPSNTTVHGEVTYDNGRLVGRTRVLVRSQEM